MKKILKIGALSLLATFPLTSFAALGGLQQFFEDVGSLVDYLIILLVGIAVLVFFWGLVRFIFKAGDEKAKDEGKRLMIWGIIALFVMVSVWGLVKFIQDQLFDDVTYDAPSLNSLIPDRP